MGCQVRLSDYIQFFKMPAIQPEPTITTPLPVEEDPDGEKVRIGDTVLASRDSRSYSLVTNINAAGDFQLKPINALLTVHRSQTPLHTDIKAHVAEFLPKFGERVASFAGVLPTLTITMPSTFKLEIGYTIFPFTEEEESYRVSTIESPVAGVQVVKGDLR